MTEHETPHRRRDDDAGSLVLIGGACDPTGPALRAFIDLSGAREGGLVVGITTASEDPARSARHWTRDLERAGAVNVQIPLIDRRDRAQSQRTADLIRSASGIFLGGGDQVVLVSTLGGSRVGRAIKEAHARGTVVCGTSAGAAALSETVLAGGEVDSEGAKVPLHLGPGLGLLAFSSVVDTHFSRRGRLQRLIQQVAANPELLGLGIDEDTALIVHGCLADVAGRGSVYYVDGRDARFVNEEEVKKKGAALTLSYLRVGLVGAGYTLNLRERELQLLVERRATEELPAVRFGSFATERSATPPSPSPAGSTPFGASTRTSRPG